jgi:tRNA threonylcarbamoyladenosine modification (KEOPS) complex Cgi121 subunit
MQYYLKEYGKYVEITGYKNINFSCAEAFLKKDRKMQNHNIEVQFFDADLIATEQHLYFAVLNALEAFKSKSNLSKSLAMETILYASAQRQIQKAISKSGIKSESTNLAAVIISQDKSGLKTVLDALTVDLGKEPDESLLKMTTQKLKRLKETFQISEKEFEIVSKDKDEKMALVDLVIEHMALLATQL